MSVTNTEKNISSVILQQAEKQLGRFPAIQQQRANAYAEFLRLGLPGNKHEEYRNTFLTQSLEKNFDFSKEAVTAGDIRLEDFSIPALETINLVFVNGVYSKKHSAQELPGNIEISTLEEALAKNSTVVLRHLAAYANYKQDAFTAWNTATWSTGVFVHVPDNTVIGKPIAIYNISDTSQQSVITQLRNLIVIGKSSEVSFIQKDNITGENPSFTNTVTEIVVNENAGVNFYTIQNDHAKPYAVNQTVVHQVNNSRVNSFAFTLDGKLIRNNLQLLIDGEGCESHMYGLYLLDNDTLADNHTVADHRKPNSFSNELYKGVMNGNSRGIFNGKIYVRPNAQKTNAFQANRNIILTDKATVNTKPQLEIWADDVKCSHGCTTGQLDEEALFYFQARGIDKESARAMLLYAFVGEVLDHVKIEALKNYLDSVIGARLNQQ
jgi:Fe-S cluster assembly protein SufD